MPNLSNNNNISSRTNSFLMKRQEISSIHIILRTLTTNPKLKNINKDVKRNSLRREYQRRNKLKAIYTDNFQILYDNYLDDENNNSYINNNYEHVLEKSKLNKRKNKKLMHLNALSQLEINKKLKNIILKQSRKKYIYQKNNIKSYFRKWKYLLNNKNKKDKNIIITNIIYKACPNDDNEFVYKLSDSSFPNLEEHFGYYNSNIAICHPINITISKGVFYLNNKSKKTDYSNNNKPDNNNNEDMEVYVVKNIKNRNISFQRNDNYTFNGLI